MVVLVARELNVFVLVRGHYVGVCVCVCICIRRAYINEWKLYGQFQLPLHRPARDVVRKEIKMMGVVE